MYYTTFIMASINQTRDDKKITNRRLKIALHDEWELRQMEMNSQSKSC